MTQPLTVFFRLSAPLLSMWLLLAGNGLQGTILGLRAGYEGFSTEAVGIIMSAYFIGYILGTLTIPKLVTNVGYIRIFAVLASAGSTMTIFHVLFPNEIAWFFMRIITGYCMMGLYLVVESWLNSNSPNHLRGRVFALYMIVNLGGIAFGQQLIHFAEVSGFTLFLLSSVLFSLAVVPVGLTRTPAPETIPSKRMKVSRLYKLAPYGVVGVFIAALCSGAFWGLFPTFGLHSGLSASDIANFLTATLIGGICMQMPVGMLSDRFDRRIMIMSMCFISATVAASVPFIISLGGNGWLYLAGFLYGGSLMTINGMSMAHINDRLEKVDIMRAASSMLMVTAIGAIIGPIIASFLMGMAGETVLFFFIAICQTVMLGFGAFRLMQRKAVSETVRKPFMPSISAFGASARFFRPKRKLENTDALSTSVDS